jgi:hypothetical protein
VTCTTVHGQVNGKMVKAKHCTTKSISGTAAFTTTAAGRRVVTTHVAVWLR